MTEVYKRFLRELEMWSATQNTRETPSYFSVEDNSYELLHCFVLPCYGGYAAIYVWDYDEVDELLKPKSPVLVYIRKTQKLYSVSAPKEWGIPSLWNLSKSYNEETKTLYVKWLKEGKIAKLYRIRNELSSDDYERMSDRDLNSLKRLAKIRLLDEMVGVDLWGKSKCSHALWLMGELHSEKQMDTLARFAAGVPIEELLQNQLAKHHYRDQAIELVKQEYKDTLFTDAELRVAKALARLKTSYPFAVNIEVAVDNRKGGVTTLTMPLHFILSALIDGCVAWKEATMPMKEVFDKGFTTLEIDVSRIVWLGYRQRRYRVEKD